MGDLIPTLAIGSRIQVNREPVWTMKNSMTVIRIK
jgi:hypothetical protein